jgi:hypothetical protein
MLISHITVQGQEARRNGADFSCVINRPLEGNEHEQEHGDLGLCPAFSITSS